MYRVIVLLATIALCHSHAVLPLVAPAHHGAVISAVPVHGYAGHGYGGLGHSYGGLGYGYGGLGHGYGGYGHGYGYGLAGHGAHHLLKRSPHIVPTVAHVAPLAVSHQSRVDLHSSPAVVATSVVAPVFHGAPILHKSLIAAPAHFGAGHYGAGAGYYGLGHYGHGHY